MERQVTDRRRKRTKARTCLTWLTWLTEAYNCLFHGGLQCLFEGHWRDHHTHTHTLAKIDRSAHFKSGGYYQIGHTAKIHLLPQHMSFIFTTCLPLCTKEKYQQSLLNICPVYSLVGLAECLSFCKCPLFSVCVCKCVYVPVHAY